MAKAYSQQFQPANENANPNRSEILPRPCQNDYYPKHRGTNVGKDTEKEELLNVVHRNIN